MKPFLFFILLAFSASVQASAVTATDPASIFREANIAYRASDYAKAASIYESLISRGKNAGVIYYNLGNAYFKQGQIGQAILQYERAKKMAPRDRDIAANLNFLRSLLEYRVEDKRNWYLRALDRALSFFTEKEIGIAGLALGLLFWISWAFSLYRQPDVPWGWRRKTFLILTLLAAFFWFLKGFHDLRVHEAIVLKPQATVRYGPSYKDQVALRLGEGIKVRIAKQEGDWSRIVLANGDTGWIPKEEIGII